MSPVKKIILILILILAAVYAMFTLISVDDEYAAEKMFYRTAKINEKITANPDVVPPAMRATVERNLKKILEKYPKTNTAKGARFALAEFYAVNKKYDSALFVLNTIINAKDVDNVTVSMARFMRGNVYEKQNQWDKALAEYALLKDKYSDTPLGIQVPIYIGNAYKAKGQDAKADSAYREAAAFYEKLRSENKGKAKGYAASSLLRDVCAGLKEYAKAGDVVWDIIRTYPSEQTFAQQLPYIELIYEGALKKPEKAVEIYKFILSNTKNDQLKKALDKKIEKLVK